MPSDTMFKAANRVHQLLLKVPGGKFGWQTGKMPVVQLTTTGRTSGKPRTVVLTSPFNDGDSMVVVASKAGSEQHPQWYLNLVENPKVEVQLKGGANQTMTARTATSDERARLWPLVTKSYDGYGKYQDKTEREIPVVLLDPQPA